MQRVAIAILLSACGSKTAPAPAPIDNQAPAPVAEAPFLAEGDYLCFGHFHEYLCTVRAIDGELRLDKVGGTDRYSGTLTPAGDGGFRLVGENGEGAAIDLVYERQPDGSWRAALPPELQVYGDHYTIRYKGELGSVFGSVTYGGGYDEPGAGY